MDRPRSTTRSVQVSSCSISCAPSPLSIPTPQGLRRTYLTPTTTAFDNDLSISRIERLSPQNQRTPTAMETGTPRLAAAVSEAKRAAGRNVPSPSFGDMPIAMDQFDKLLSRGSKFGNTPLPVTITPTSTYAINTRERDDDGSPNVAAKVVHNVMGDDARRRELLLGLQKLFSGKVNTSGNTASQPATTSTKGISRGATPNRIALSPVAQPEPSLATIAKALRGISPNHPQPSHHDGRGGGHDREELHLDPSARSQMQAPPTFTQEPRKGICRPKPTEKGSEKSRLFAEALATRQVPTSKKVIKSEISAFSETTESSSKTSYSTKSSRHVQGDENTTGLQ